MRAGTLLRDQRRHPPCPPPRRSRAADFGLRASAAVHDGTSSCRCSVRWFDRALIAADVLRWKVSPPDGWYLHVKVVQAWCARRVRGGMWAAITGSRDTFAAVCRYRRACALHPDGAVSAAELTVPEGWPARVEPASRSVKYKTCMNQRWDVQWAARTCRDLTSISRAQLVVQLECTPWVERRQIGNSAA
jgi:hypothetical protein